MKIVISSEGAEMNSVFDLRFGRAAYFCVYNEESGITEFLKNEHADDQGGAGTKTSEKMVELGVQKVISGDFGPKAKDILERFNIQMVILPDNNRTVGEIIETLKGK
ncbi:MAG: hypothetical protein K9H49_11920 [Bacteroidales bacterium]|nr:hypothetical protein [Bacteroidales bacterium]MCF8390810.1 hypothetical protein [Bacteroidales bacterium]